MPATKPCLPLSKISSRRLWLRPMIFTIDSAAIKLTDTILGYSEQDLEETLKTIAADIGVCHIAYLRLSPDKSADASLLAAIVTYSVRWQHRYFEKKSVLIARSRQKERKAFLPLIGRNWRPM